MRSSVGTTPSRLARFHVDARDRARASLCQCQGWPAQYGLPVRHRRRRRRPLYKYDTIPKNWVLPDLKRAVDRTQFLIRDTDGWSTVFMENHDQARSISRFASDTPEHRVASGKLPAILQRHAVRYLIPVSGQEIGQVNAPIDTYPISQYKDVEALLFLQRVTQSAGGTLRRSRCQRFPQRCSISHVTTLVFLWPGTVRSRTVASRTGRRPGWQSTRLRGK